MIIGTDIYEKRAWNGNILNARRRLSPELTLAHTRADTPGEPRAPQAGFFSQSDQLT